VDRKYYGPLRKLQYPDYLHRIDIFGSAWLEPIGISGFSIKKKLALTLGGRILKTHSEI
jgi:hypothetical protein